jgi:hypothetical protein
VDRRIRRAVPEITGGWAMSHDCAARGETKWEEPLGVRTVRLS